MLGFEALWEKPVAYGSVWDVSNESEGEGEGDALSGILLPAENDEVFDGRYGCGGLGLGRNPWEEYLPLEEYLVTSHRHEQFWGIK
jgi:hypothetical protein